MHVNKHDRFIVFCLNTCSWLLSERHVCVHGCPVWCNHLFTYSRYHFSSCQWEQSKNIPRCGLGLLRICSRNSRQEEVALTNALIWKRAANTPTPVWQETPLLHWFLLGFTDSLQPCFCWSLLVLLSPSLIFPSLCHASWLPSLSHASISSSFSHYLIRFNCQHHQKRDWDSPPSVVILFFPFFPNFEPLPPSSVTPPPSS